MVSAQVQPVAFTVQGAVAYSSLSRSRLYMLMRSKTLPSVRVGGRRMILREALDALYSRATTTAN